MQIYTDAAASMPYAEYTDYINEYTLLRKKTSHVSDQQLLV